MSIGMPNINQYFKVAMSYPVAKLQAVMRGQDHSIPMVAAMAAYEIKSPMEIAAKAQQAAQKQSTVSIRDKLAREGEEEKNGMMPDNLMMAMQQQQQGSLPENTGIGRLPAPNMQTMHAANGGIIAFDDGGYVPGYAEGDMVEEETSSPIGRSLTDLFSGPDGAREQYEAQQRKLKKERDLAAKEFETTGGGFKQQTKAQRAEAARIAKERAKLTERPASKEPQYKPYPTDAKPRAVDPTAGQAVTDANASPGFIRPEQMPAKKPTAPPVVSGIPTKAPVDTEQQMADTLSRISGTQDAEIKSQYADLEKKTGEGIAALRREREVGKPTGKAYEGLEKELLEEKNAVKGKEDKNLQMALVNAGLAIAGGTSRYALENIGKGALVGTKQYMDGLDKLEAAAKERRKMTAMIDEARRAEARGDWKEKNDFESKAFELGVNSRKYSIDALSKIYDTNKKAAVDIFNRLETDKAAMERTKEQGRSAEKVAGIHANMYKERGGGEYNVLADNARARYDKWASSAAGQIALMKDPSLEATKYREFLQDEYKNKAAGLTGGATMPGGSPVKFLGFEKQ